MGALRGAQPREAVPRVRAGLLRRDHGAPADGDRGAVGGLRGVPQEDLQALQVSRRKQARVSRARESTHPMLSPHAHTERQLMYLRTGGPHLSCMHAKYVERGGGRERVIFLVAAQKTILNC